MDFVRASETHPKFVGELPSFITEVKQIFEPHELHEYLGGLRRIGAMGHLTTDDEFVLMQEAGVFDENPVRGAENVLIVERIRRCCWDERDLAHTGSVAGRLPAEDRSGRRHVPLCLEVRIRATSDSA